MPAPGSPADTQTGPARVPIGDRALQPAAHPGAPPRALAHVALGRVRGAIDLVDDGLIALLAARRKLVQAAARLKRRLSLPARDPNREQQVRARGRRLAWRLGCPDSSAQQVLDLAIADACRQQGLEAGMVLGPGRSHDESDTPGVATMSDPSTSPAFFTRILRCLPPPHRLSPLLRSVPERWQRRLLERAIDRVLVEPERDGSLEFMRDRRLGIEVSDLGMCWVLSWDGRCLRVVEGAAEASVRGTVTDLALLAGRLEDADTLFFQRRLVLTGDTELGLTARNLLERLPWESIPLGLRIVLNRGARLARLARDSYRGQFA